MTGLVFVDTNVFVYRHDSSDPSKQSRAEQWITLLVHHRSGRLSFQVLQELYATLTRRRLNFDRSQAREIVEILTEWRPVAVNRALLWIAPGCWNRAICSPGGMLSSSPRRRRAGARSCSPRTCSMIRVIDPFASPDRTPEEVLESLAS